MVALAQAVQTATFNGTLATLTYATNPTANHLLVAILIDRGGGVTPVAPTGWTKAASGGQFDEDEGVAFYRTAPGGAVSFTIPGGGGPTDEQRLYIMEFDNAGVASLVDTSSGTGLGPAYAVDTGAVDILEATGGLLIGYRVTRYAFPITFTEDPDYTTISKDLFVAGGLGPQSIVSYRSVALPGTYDYVPEQSQSLTSGGALLAFEFAPVFTADFVAEPRSGTPPLTVEFNDTSSGGTGTPNSWLWDFGDGSTSTSQHPSHSYTVVGSYDVTLTVGTDDGESDSVTKTAFVLIGSVYVEPGPSNAVIEIYVAAANSARWGVALWGEDLWSSAGWVDVTPQSVEAVVRWGSHQPERGILAETEAGSWRVDTYDPERLLDPGNLDSPYATDLRAGLPIRIRHRGTIVRQGICETIAYFHKDKQGGIRATDNVSTMARTPVPDDSILSDTLRARARDVIAAAGLSITVEPDPPSGDPALAPRLEGVTSVWRHVSDAAEQTLHLAYVDRYGTLRFRAWASPYDRGRFVDGTNLIDLGTIVQTAGLYSVIQARDEITELIEERRITPPPQYGRVTYTRDELTPDAGAWAAAVLADRALQGLQWVPGEIYPITANDVEYFALLESMEQLEVFHEDGVPPVAITGNIIGGEFRVLSKRESEALWRFTLELAQTGTAETSPLVDDVDGEFLLNEASDAYLYPG